MALSVLASQQFAVSLSGIIDDILAWYIPFFALLLVINSKNDIIRLIYTITTASIFVALAGVLEFYLQRRYYFDIFPRSMLAAMMQNNPAIEQMINYSPFRNGFYRASSIFGVSLPSVSSRR